jgi:xanthosine utilization system XapX-like protein
MLRGLTGLYESTPAEFRSSYVLEEAVARLRAATKRSAFSALDQTQAVGKVSADRVHLQRIIPMVRNSFKPFFTGHFEVREGLAVLTGHFGMSMPVRIFMTFWLGMVALVAVGFLLANFELNSPHSPWTAIAPLCMLAAGFGLVQLGKWFSRNDAAWLSSVIAHALGVPGVGGLPTPEPWIDVADGTMALKGASLFLAASGLAAALTYFMGPRSWLMGTSHWNIVYAIAALVLAAGVWLRRLWAWWGVFVVLGLSVASSLSVMLENPELLPPPFVQVIFGIFSLVVIGIWGRWWHAQRRFF